MMSCAVNHKLTSWTRWCQVMILCVTVSMLPVLTSATPPESCDVAQNKCTLRAGCSMALHNYWLSCNGLIHGDTNDCSQACLKSIISLLSTQDKEGENLMTCDCQGVAFCEMQKSRLSVCTSNVVEAMKSLSDDDTNISCSLAELICKADTSCLTALQYYQQNCVKMLRGQKCTRRCNNSLGILYDQPKARKLRTCICDNTEEYDCMTVRRRTQNLCFQHMCRHGQCERHSYVTLSTSLILPTTQDTSTLNNAPKINVASFGTLAGLLMVTLTVLMR